MPETNTSISPENLSRLIGTPGCPALIDSRIDEDFDLDPRMIPTSRRRSAFEVEDWASDYAGQEVVICCHKGLKLSQGAAAWLRHNKVATRHLEGGFVAWQEAGLPLISPGKLPARDARGRTVWVTRSRPKIDRIACPWLIRRFIDREAVILFVDPAEVEAVAEKFDIVPFDVEGVHWSHRGDHCTFDTMLAEFGLDTPPLRRLAGIVRGADTARPDLAPEAAGLLAASLGLSQMYDNDLEQLEKGLELYDAFYRWARDAAEETHNWPATQVGDAA